MTDDLRSTFLDRHNSLRSSIANGHEPNKVGLAPPASNMQKMVYDCAVEASAIRSANTCTGQLSPPSTRPGLKENDNNIKDMSLTPEEAAEKAMSRWWGQLSRNGVPSNMFFSDALRHRQPPHTVTRFTKMAWHNNVRLGCAVKKCSGFYFVVCQYGPGGNIVGQNIYDIGAVCSKCPSGTRCDAPMGLCGVRGPTSGAPPAPGGGATAAPVATTTKPANTCPSNAGVSESLRQTYLTKHNSLRSSLAKGNGEQRNGNKGPAPPASNMEKMKYDCSVEASALRHAQTCDGQLSPASSRPGLKENIIKINDMSLSENAAASKAMDKWWAELPNSGVGQDMKFTDAIRHRTTNIVTHWSKMAWHNNNRLGCALQRCSGFYFAVCQYGPGGNVVGEFIYNVAAVCSACPAGTKCDPATALCG
ncbi:hypothetical protein Aduo_004515 [Ancylostoma duodenale]